MKCYFHNFILLYLLYVFLIKLDINNDLIDIIIIFYNLSLIIIIYIYIDYL